MCVRVFYAVKIDVPASVGIPPFNTHLQAQLSAAIPHGESSASIFKTQIDDYHNL